MPAEMPPAPAAPETPASAEPIVNPRDRIYSDEEIRKMEDRAEYHGDDPIVRARLGLPSRETKRLLR
jgi:hypothetical protein